jgi:hexosaminidase
MIGIRLRTKKYKTELERQFDSWIYTASPLNALASTHPLIAKIEVRREQLPRLGRLGREAVGYIEAHQRPFVEWTETETAFLKIAGNHADLTDFVVLAPLNELVEASGNSIQR